MIHLTQETLIHLACDPLDFRKGIDGVVAVCQYTLKQNPRSGHLFVFFNRNRTMIRILAYEKNGYWLMSKRLSKGRFPRFKSVNQCLTPLASRTLRQLLLGQLSTTSDLT